MRWLLRELGAGMGGPSFPRYALVKVDEPAWAQEARTEAQHVVRSLERELHGEDLRHDVEGNLRLLVTASDALDERMRFGYRELAADDARSLLTALASDTHFPPRVRELVGRAVPFVAPPTRSSQERIVVIRRLRPVAPQVQRIEAPREPVIARREAPRRDWLEFQFVDDAGNPMANERYEVQLPDGSVQSGQLDASGRAHLPDVPIGVCSVSFPAFKPRLAS